MGKKNKLKKFADLLSYPNVYENYDPKFPKLLISADTEADMIGNWRTSCYKNSNPLILELACGRGEYTEALVQAYPDQNFLGVDVKGARIWMGASHCLEKGLTNAAFLRTRIEQISLFFGTNEVDGIWITFPDPFLRESKENKRLTSARFLDQYKKIIKPGAILHLKTDDPTLYHFTLDTLLQYQGAHIIYKNDDIYAHDLDYDELKYKTHYEKEHLADGRKIKYIRFTIN
ncbi:MAG: tRNA (guanosine(46)-N7)-methyltransferase TrmB [Saprospiraceae bacterium]|nr:tRNA (guanosine(46)-N7)-methyltransferase TrmB [Saprospiraceae bacterium]